MPIFSIPPLSGSNIENPVCSEKRERVAPQGEERGGREEVGGYPTPHPETPRRGSKEDEGRHPERGRAPRRGVGEARPPGTGRTGGVSGGKSGAFRGPPSRLAGHSPFKTDIGAGNRVTQKGAPPRDTQNSMHLNSAAYQRHTVHGIHGIQARVEQQDTQNRLRAHGAWHPWDPGQGEHTEQQQKQQVREHTVQTGQQTRETEPRVTLPERRLSEPAK